MLLTLLFSVSGFGVWFANHAVRSGYNGSVLTMVRAVPVYALLRPTDYEYIDSPFRDPNDSCFDGATVLEGHAPNRFYEWAQPDPKRNKLNCQAAGVTRNGLPAGTCSPLLSKYNTSLGWSDMTSYAVYAVADLTASVAVQRIVDAREMNRADFLQSFDRAPGAERRQVREDIFLDLENFDVSAIDCVGFSLVRVEGSF